MMSPRKRYELFQRNMMLLGNLDSIVVSLILAKIRSTDELELLSCAKFHPLKYLEGLAEAVEKHGGKIFEQTRAFNIEGSKDQKTVTAGAVVLTTGSPLNHSLTIHARQMADRSYAIGMKIPRSAVKQSSTILSTEENYHYVRVQSGQDYGVDYDIWIVGGEDTSTGMKPEDYRDHDPYTKLANWTRERWIMASEVLYKWTGQVYEPDDYLHLIGKEPLKSDEIYIVTGDSGQWTGNDVQRNRWNVDHRSHSEEGESMGQSVQSKPTSSCFLGRVLQRWRKSYSHVQVIQKPMLNLHTRLKAECKRDVCEILLRYKSYILTGVATHMETICFAHLIFDHQGNLSVCVCNNCFGVVFF